MGGNYLLLLLFIIIIIIYKNDPSVIDLWPSKYKFNRSHVLTKTNRHVKCKSFVMNCS